MDNWYSTGYNQAEKEIKDRGEFRIDLIRRFWMKKGTSTQIVIASKEPTVIREHELRIAGNYNVYTCIGPENCLICKAGKEPYLVGYYAIFDLTKYKAKSGNPVECSFKVLPAKSYSLEMFQIKSKKIELIGALFDVTRTNQQKAPRIGDIWDYVKQVDLLDEPYVSKIPKGFSLIEYLKPKSGEELKAVLTMDEKDNQRNYNSVDEKIDNEPINEFPNF